MKNAHAHKEVISLPQGGIVKNYAVLFFLCRSTGKTMIKLYIPILFLAFIWLSDYNYSDMPSKKKGLKSYGVYVCTSSSETVGHFRKTGTEAMRRKAHTECFKTQLYVAHTKVRGKPIDGRTKQAKEQKFESKLSNLSV